MSAYRGGKRCAAYGCPNTHADGVSLHAFPLDRPAVCKQWIKFVRNKRDKWDGPTKYSCLCSKHFEDSAYPIKYSLMRSMDRTPPKKRTLNEDAIPTIQCINSDTININLMPIHQSTPKVKKLRIAYLKRENTRIATQYSESETQLEPVVEDMDIDTTEDNTASGSTLVQTLMSDSETMQSTSMQTRTCATQLSYKRPPSRSARTQVKPRVAEKGCQTVQEKPQMKSVGVQCNILRPDIQQTKLDHEPPSDHEELDLSWASSKPQEDLDDISYVPSESDHSEAESDCDIDDENMSATSERLFLVSEGCLLQLFSTCFSCSSPALGDLSQVCGTMVKVEQSCGVCGHSWKWYSQPMIGSIPTGNLRLSCGILFSGSLPSKALRIFDFMNVSSISTDTFLKHQRHYLQPAILDVWERSRLRYIQEIKRDGLKICIGGDGRCDTPGHSAKFGSYSVMDLDSGMVLDVQLVQSNEVKSSCHMEKEGLIRSVSFLEGHDIKIGTIVTDRHVQIRKWVRENMKSTKHCVDVWHVAKGLKKKLLAIANLKDCEELHDWIRSISNHLYWVAASTPSANSEVMWQKWASLENHIQNIHEGHGNQFPQCLHEDLRGQEKRRKWLKPGSKSLVKLEALLSSRQMKLDIPMLSTSHQTSEIEGYHSMINHFAPKMHGFSFNGMLCRLLLAALHFNENGGREQAVTSQGELCYKITFPKYKKGGYTLREVKTESTFNYVKELTHNVVGRTSKCSMSKSKKEILPNAPPPLCSSFERPVKEQAVSIFQSRFCQHE